jgi:DNA-binding MarR family transcriptional regulator
MDSLRRIVRSLHVFTRKTQREFGVSAAQFFVLRQLAMSPRMSVTELARRTRTSQSSVSEVVTALVKLGLVVRQIAPDDRRRAELALSPRGRRLLEKRPMSVQEHLVVGLERLDADQRRALRTGLEAWLVASGLGDVPATMFFESSIDPAERVQEHKLL